MYTRIAAAIFTLSLSVYSYAQRSPEGRWTDKNNAEEYAAYMIQIAYNDLGYMGARVQIREEGTRRIFEVDPGRMYHIKAVRIVGENGLPLGAMAGAPSVGDVYSATRMNDWIAALKSGYGKAATWGVRFDHPNADATIEVKLNTDPILGPK
jgi:outer membrane protein assembly factor BamA